MARDTDPRYQRVRARLTSALLELAATKPAETISVSELTSAAQVSRAAFYAHANSPAGLLAEVLINDLRPDFERFAAQVSLPDAVCTELWRQVYLALLEQVREHREVYANIVAQESAVSSALTSYFEEVALPYINAVAGKLEGDPPSRLWLTLARFQQAHSMMAVVRAWIATDMEDPPEDVVDTYLTLAPPWQLARADEQGVTSFHRIRAVWESA